MVRMMNQGSVRGHLLFFLYKNAVKEAAQEAEAELNDDLMNHLCTKNNTRFWKAWRKRFLFQKCQVSQCR